MKKWLLPLGLCGALVPLNGCIVICVGTPPPGIGRPGAEVQHQALEQPARGLPKGKPQRLNIDFGPCLPDSSKQTGPAAAGREGDFWNAVARSFNNDHREGGLKTATGEPSPIEVEMLNLGGAWGASGKLGIKDPMLDSFNYPVNNQGGNSEVILHAVPPGKYDVYLYGHGTVPEYYGDYTLKVGDHNYGRKTTFHEDNRGQDTRWIEGRQYVKFSGVQVAPNAPVDILIRPGGEVEDHGRVFADAIIAGLQLVPAK